MQIRLAGITSTTDVEVEVADALAKEIDVACGGLLFDEGQLWCYDISQGIFAAPEDADVLNLVYDLHRAKTGGGVFTATAARANAILRITKSRVNRSGFFAHSQDGVSVQNGFLAVDGNTIFLISHSTDQRQRSQIEVAFDRDADTSECDGFLFDTFGDQSLVDFLYEVLGVAIFGYGAKYQVIIVFLGKGANSKGVITKLIRKFIPPTMRSSVPPSEWHMDYQRFPLVGSRLNTVGELPELLPKFMEALKSISAGDSITARRVGSTAFEFEPSALHIFSTNRLPALPETGEAIKRRFAVLPFTRIVPPEKRVPDYEVELFKHAGQGLLRRTVEGFERVLKRGRFSQPEAVRIATLQWMHHSDVVRVFAEVRLERVSDPKARITAEDMYQECCSFCAKAHLSPPSSKKSLSSRLKQLGFCEAKSSTMVWIGVKFRDSP